MATNHSGRQKLVVYGPSPRADGLLRKLAEAARHDGTRVTVVALAPDEPESGCCDTRSVYWNGVCRELARHELERASQMIEGEEAVELAVLSYRGRHASDAVMREASARGADEIWLADPAKTGLGRRERRRLRRQSTIPVRE